MKVYGAFTLNDHQYKSESDTFFVVPKQAGNPFYTVLRYHRWLLSVDINRKYLYPFSRDVDFTFIWTTALCKHDLRRWYSFIDNRCTFQTLARPCTAISTSWSVQVQWKR